MRRYTYAFSYIFFLTYFYTTYKVKTNFFTVPIQFGFYIEAFMLRAKLVKL